MHLTQLQWLKQSGWNVSDGTPSSLPQLVLVFGGGSALRETDALVKLRMLYPQALFFGCSTAGEIRGTEVGDDTIVATASHTEAIRRLSRFAPRAFRGTLPAGRRSSRDRH